MAMFVGCSICQEMFTVTRPFVVTRCGHAFDDQCLRDWLKKEKTCPTCRAPTHEKTLLKAFFSVVPDDTDDDKKCCEELNRKMEELQLSTVEDTSMYLCQIQNLEEQVRHFEQEAKFMKNITMEKMKMMTSKNSDLERRIMELKMANQRLIDERNHFLRSNSVRERHFVELSHVLKQMEEEQRQKSEEKNILALNNFTLQSEVERLKELMSVLECGQKGMISEKNFLDLQRENKKLRGEMKTLENNHKQKLESMNKKLHKMMFE